MNHCLTRFTSFFKNTASVRSLGLCSYPKYAAATTKRVAQVVLHLVHGFVEALLGEHLWQRELDPLAELAHVCGPRLERLGVLTPLVLARRAQSSLARLQPRVALAGHNLDVLRVANLPNRVLGWRQLTVVLLEALEEHLVPLAQRVLAFELHCVRGRTGGPVHETAIDGHAG